MMLLIQETDTLSPQVKVLHSEFSKIAMPKLGQAQIKPLNRDPHLDMNRKVLEHQLNNSFSFSSSQMLLELVEVNTVEPQTISYLRDLEREWLLEVPEVFLVSEEFSRSWMMTTVDTLIRVSSTKLSRIIESMLLQMKGESFSEFSMSTEMDQSATMNS